MFVKLTLFLVFLSICLIISSGQNCEKAARIKVDGTYAKLMVLGGSGRKWPEDKKGQLKIFCDQTTQYLNDADDYKNKCLKTYPKQITGVITYSIRNTINQYCKRDSRKLTELVESTPCANAAKKEVDQCYANLIDKFQGAFNAETKMRLPYTCCEYYKFLDCIKERGLKVKKCTEKSLDVTANFIRDIFGEVVDILCGDYTEDSDKCEKIGQTPKKKKSQRRSKSFMLPLIDTVASLPE